MGWLKDLTLALPLGKPSLTNMGELAIVRAREKAEKTLGAKFNIRAFHDACSSSARSRCPLSRRGSTVSSPKAAQALTRIGSK